MFARRMVVCFENAVRSAYFILVYLSLTLAAVGALRFDRPWLLIVIIEVALIVVSRRRMSNAR